jgi:hypothetical protein
VSILRRTPAWAITASLGLVYVIAAPPSTDLAAAAYRSDLFARVGFTIWDNSWYGGHHLPAYSMLAPALGAWIGPQLVGALSMTAATALFALLIDGFFAPRATRIAAVWLAVGASVSLLSNRIPFDLGLALGLGALLAARHNRRAATVALAVLCSLASPVAGAFLALAFLAWGLADRGRRWPFVLVLVALVPIGMLAVTFPEGGTQPFAASAFYPGLTGVLLIAALIARDRVEPARRVLLIGSLLYAAMLVGAYFLPTAVGSNADRLGALFAGPIAACALTGRPPRWLLPALAPFLLYWQVNAPVSDFLSAASDPAVDASYYAPLLGELRSLGVGYSGRPARIEAVPTTNHWEARFLAPHVPLARGWERQLDQGRNGLFYDEGPLTGKRYREWLSEQAVSYVALPDAPLDYSAVAEGRLLLNGAPPARAGTPNGKAQPGKAQPGKAQPGGAQPGRTTLPGRLAHPPGYLREVWRSAHWRLFAVIDPRPLVQAPATMTGLGVDSFTVKAPRPGNYTARVRFTPYWAISSGRGCVREAPGGWTEVRAGRAGELKITIDFSLGRVFERGERCR